MSDPAPPPAQRGIQSVEVGGQLLVALAHHGRPMALKDLAREAGMVPAKAHPYLVSFGKLGLIVQDEGSGRYGLGPLAMQIGLMSLQQYDPVRLATPLLGELARRLGHTVGMAVWGNLGATVVHIEEAPSEIHVNMRHGTVMSLRNTASGRVFAAYLPKEVVQAALKQEALLERGLGGSSRLLVPPLTGRAFEAELALVRQHRLSHSVDAVVPGISAIAAPVFDLASHVVLTLIAIGPSAVFDADFESPLAQQLRAAADELTQRLGGQPPG